MAWEQRQGGSYFYRKIRTGQRVRSVYVGKDPAPSNLMRDGRRRRLPEDQVSSREAAVRSFCGAVQMIEHHTLESAGFRRHNRGEWRKRRMSRDGALALIVAARSDPGACGELWNTMDRDGVSERLTEAVLSVEATLINSAVASLVEREAFRRKMTEMRRDLGYDVSPALERILIDRIVICWLHLTLDERREAAARMQASGTGSRLSGAAADSLGARIDRAQRRFLSAARSLAVVRKLALPTLQLNLSDRQVNIIQSCSGPVPDPEPVQ